MKTLADFKRAIQTGTEIEYVKCEERAWSDQQLKHVGELYPVRIADDKRGARYVSHKDTTGFYLKRSDAKAIRGSFCGWPKAAELEYEGDQFIITDVSRDGEVYQRRYYKIIK